MRTITTEQPSFNQFKSWFSNKNTIRFIYRDKSYQGTISDLRTSAFRVDHGGDTASFVLTLQDCDSESLPDCFFFSSITSFIAPEIPNLEPIFATITTPSNTVSDVVTLQSGERSFAVKKSVLAERTEFFRILLTGGFSESFLSVIDLRPTFSPAELEALLLFLNSVNANFLKNATQAMCLLSALKKIAINDYSEQLENWIFENITADVNYQFH